MNLPNQITIARLVLTAGVFVALGLAAPDGDVAYTPHSVEPAAADPTLAWLAFALFLLASGTDWLDGYLARKLNLVTAFGRIADPFADKVLIIGTLVMLLQDPAATTILTHWYVVVIIAREFLITAIRSVVEASGEEFGADQLGKYKFVAQAVMAAALLSMVAGSDLFYWPAVLGYWVSLVLTIGSGLNYCVKARHVILKGGV